MTKYNVKHIALSFIMSLFLFASVSTLNAAPQHKSASVFVEKGESVKQVVRKMTKALAKQGYELRRGDAEHIGKVAKIGVEMAARGRPRIECDYLIFNCRMVDL